MCVFYFKKLFNRLLKKNLRVLNKTNSFILAALIIACTTLSFNTLDAACNSFPGLNNGKCRILTIFNYNTGTFTSTLVCGDLSEDDNVPDCIKDSGNGGINGGG